MELVLLLHFEGAFAPCCCASVSGAAWMSACAIARTPVLLAPQLPVVPFTATGTMSALLSHRLAFFHNLRDQHLACFLDRDAPDK